MRLPAKRRRAASAPPARRRSSTASTVGSHPRAIGQAPERAPEIARLRHVRAHRARPSLAEQVEEAVARDLLRRGNERVAMPVHRGDAGEIEGGGFAHGSLADAAIRVAVRRATEPLQRRSEYHGGVMSGAPAAAGLPIGTALAERPGCSPPQRP